MARRQQYYGYLSESGVNFVGTHSDACVRCMFEVVLADNGYHIRLRIGNRPQKEVETAHGLGHNFMASGTTFESVVKGICAKVYNAHSAESDARCYRCNYKLSTSSWRKSHSLAHSMVILLQGEGWNVTVANTSNKLRGTTIPTLQDNKPNKLRVFN